MDSFAITEGLVSQEPQDDQTQSPVSAKLTEETNKFQRAIAAWRGKSRHACGQVYANLNQEST